MTKMIRDDSMPYISYCGLYYTPMQWSVIVLNPMDHACFCSVTLA